MRLQLVIRHKKSSFLRFYKTRANKQRLLPEQTGLYRYDEWMVQDIYDKNLNGRLQNLMEVNLVR